MTRFLVVAPAGYRLQGAATDKCRVFLMLLPVCAQREPLFVPVALIRRAPRVGARPYLPAYRAILSGC